MNRALVDTGPIYAAADDRDEHHLRCADFFRGWTGDLLILPTVIAEVCHMINRTGRADVEAAFLESVARGDFCLTEIRPGDLARAAHLVREYASLGLGGTDASIIAVAERLRIETIVTIDVRDFSVVRAAHCQGFTLLPS